MKTSTTLLALLGSAALAFGDAEVGKPASDFTATDINDKTIKLSDYKGKIVVLESYNQDCPSVTINIKAAQCRTCRRN